MQCKSCGTELPKKAKICPKCGALNGKPAGNTRYLAIIGMVIMLIGGLLPFAKSNETLMDGYTPKAYSFGFMNIKRHCNVVHIYVNTCCWYFISCC